MKIFKILVLLIIVASCKSAKYPELSEGLYADFDTSKGTILVQLNYIDLPLTVSNFVSLAEGTNTKVTDSLKGKPFYNGLKFHRVIDNFMIQGGDPAGNGSGDPGYKFSDEFPRDTANQIIYKHKKGVISMANSGPATNGSQFFITHVQTPWLDGKHSVFGHVVKGQEVVDSIQQNDTIKSVEIIKIGRSAKKFKAAKVFEKLLEKSIEEEKQKSDQFIADSKLFYTKMLGEKAKELSSGLKILTKKEGNGNYYKPGKTMLVHYTGYLSNGKMFESSYEKGEPIVFKPIKDKVIAGWNEGIPMLSEGEKAVLFIPYHLGFGVHQTRNIPGKSNLIFEVEIIEIK